MIVYDNIQKEEVKKMGNKILLIICIEDNSSAMTELDWKEKCKECTWRKHKLCPVKIGQ